MQEGVTAVPVVADRLWRNALQRVIRDPGRLTLHAQPIVELTSARIVGFEMLSRFDGPWAAAPDIWFAAAERWDFNATLQGRVVSAGIAARALLPPDTFLTVNVDPHLLGRPEIADVLTGTADLSRLVLELTEHTQLVDDGEAAAVLDHVRAAGGLVAMDDAGSGYAGLSTLLSLRPNIVKLDRELITGIDQDPVKRALVEMFGELAGRMDAWVLAEGIETLGELDTVIGLGVPLGQGYVLARPSATMLAELGDEMGAHIRSTATRTSLQGNIASLIRPVEVGTDDDRDEVLLAADGRAALVRLDGWPPGESLGRWAPAMTMAPSAALVEAARRAMARAPAHRFAPLVCTDGAGAVLGVVRIDDLLMALCASSESSAGR
jgi:EAL domain-containing protein (putative c-di-GMP-specific phosphodiesterase class I)